MIAALCCSAAFIRGAGIWAIGLPSHHPHLQLDRRQALCRGIQETRALLKGTEILPIVPGEFVASKYTAVGTVRAPTFVYVEWSGGQ